MSSSTQANVMQLLYQSCGGPNWHTSTNWNDQSINVCDWFGITCDETQSIIDIALGSNGLTGTIPTEIFLLPQLKRLSLFANSVFFSFDGIENAQNLHVLILDETGLTSLAGAGNAVGLRQLNVRFNQITGPIPAELSRLTNLQALGLSGNALTGTVPTWLSQLSMLQTLLLANNQLSGTLSDFHGLAQLDYLDLSSNRLTGTVPQDLLPSLPVEVNVLVDLSNNMFSGTLSSQLASRGNGLAVDLQNNQISAVDANLCTSSQYQCDGILCPAGTFNIQGRQTNANTPCQDCPQAKFMGSIQCSGQSSVVVRGSIASFVLILCSLSAAWTYMLQ
jgi:hypothetical protein